MNQSNLIWLIKSMSKKNLKILNLFYYKKKKKLKKDEDIAPSNQNSDVDFSKFNISQCHDLSDTMEEGTISSWLKKVGDEVKEGDILAEIETDKATMEFESFHDGKLIHIGVNEGETVNVDELIAIISPVEIDAEQALANYNSGSPNPRKRKMKLIENKSEELDRNVESSDTVSDKRFLHHHSLKKLRLIKISI